MNSLPVPLGCATSPILSFVVGWCAPSSDVHGEVAGAVRCAARVNGHQNGRVTQVIGISHRRRVTLFEVTKTNDHPFTQSIGHTLSRAGSNPDFEPEDIPDFDPELEFE